MLSLNYCADFLLVAASRPLSVVGRLSNMVAFPAVATTWVNTWASALWHGGSVVVAPRLHNTGSVVVVHGLAALQHTILLIESNVFHRQADSLQLSHQGSLR